MRTFSEFLVENAIDTGIIKVEGKNVTIPDVNTLDLSMERLDEVIKNLDEMKGVIETSKDELENYVARYEELIQDIPQLGGLNREIPQDLIENYRQATMSVKEQGIPEKIRRNEKLNLKDQLAWLDWKNLKSSKDFITGGNNKIWGQIEELNDHYKSLINISRHNIQNLDSIGEKMDVFSKCATGVQGLLQTLSKMPRDMINMEDLLMNLQGLTTNYMEIFEYCTTNALNLDKRIDGVELTGEFSRTLTKTMETAREKTKEAEEKGVDVNLIRGAEKDLALIEEAEREARTMEMRQDKNDR